MEFFKDIDEAEIEYTKDYGEGRHGYRCLFFGGAFNFTDKRAHWPVEGIHKVRVKLRVYAPGKCAMDVEPLLEN